MGRLSLTHVVGPIEAVPPVPVDPPVPLEPALPVDPDVPPEPLAELPPDPAGETSPAVPPPAPLAPEPEPSSPVGASDDAELHATSCAASGVSNKTDQPTSQRRIVTPSRPIPRYETRDGGAVHYRPFVVDFISPST
jgi:hypothetical protein